MGLCLQKPDGRCVRAWSDRLPRRRSLPWLPVATAPATVWSMYQGNVLSVYPSGASAVLQPLIEIEAGPFHFLAMH